MNYIDRLYDKIYEENNIVNIKETSIEYTPKLNKIFLNEFNKLALKIQNKDIKQKIDIINEEIITLIQENNDDIEYIKYMTSVYVLRDLLMQGWRFYYEDKIYLSNPIFRIDDKDVLRLRLECEKKTQFNIESNKNFILKMEKEKVYKNNKISIKNLIGDSKILLDKISNFKNSNKGNIVEPYLQLVDNTNDIFTGYKLNEIWRYFRYTWSIPYKNTPGRNIYYLIRDRAQPFNPIIGIAALGNCVINLTPRDNYIGWTLEAIKDKLIELRNCEEDYQDYCYNTVTLLRSFIDNEINEIYYNDIITSEEFNNPTELTVEKLIEVYETIKDIPTNARVTRGDIDYLEESQTILYKKKRALELSKLVEAKLTLANLQEYTDLLDVIDKANYKKAFNVALKANRKVKIGSNIMEIIVCGSIPPYNEILGGKLVSLLITSPQVIKDYKNRYKNQVSEIASRMKGGKVVRNSDLVFLGTTSLYSMGSSQYNRIKKDISKDFTLQYKEIGKTEGYGSVFFSNDTTQSIAQMLLLIDGARKINNVFGEGSSPRMRLIVSGLRALGINSKEFLNHYSPRIVYGIDLASNSKEYLRGEINNIKYYFEEGEEELYTEEIINFWKSRWLNRRIYNVDIEERLEKYNIEDILLSNFID